MAEATTSASGPNTLDTHTIPIVIGTIGAVLTLATIVIGIVQIRAMRCRLRDVERNEYGHELDQRPPAPSHESTVTPPFPNDHPEGQVTPASTSSDQPAAAKLHG